MTKETKVGLVVGLLFMVGVVYLLSWFSSPSDNEQTVSQYIAQDSGQEQAAEPVVDSQPTPPIPLRADVSRDAAPPVVNTTTRTEGEVSPPIHGGVAPVPPGVVGSTPLVSSVPVVPAEPQQRFYVVKEGDTLGEIAETVYGPGHQQDWKRILDANRHKVASERAIRPDMKLLIPPLEQAAPVSSTSDGSAARGLTGSGETLPSSGPRTYTVVSGDTLSEISSKTLGTSKRWQEILSLNRDKVPDEDHLKIGTVLKLPAAGAAAP